MSIWLLPALDQNQGRVDLEVERDSYLEAFASTGVFGGTQLNRFLYFLVQRGLVPPLQHYLWTFDRRFYHLRIF